jgi:hypothetical protein
MTGSSLDKDFNANDKFELVKKFTVIDNALQNNGYSTTRNANGRKSSI